MNNDNLSIENRQEIQYLMTLSIHYACKACEYLALYFSVTHTICLNCINSHPSDCLCYTALKSRFSFCSSIEMRKRLKDLSK